MTVTVSGHCKRAILGILIFFGISSFVMFSKDVSGNLSQPMTHVVTIGINKVTVDNVTGFAVGDTILLIQMQGVGILTAGPYGAYQQKFGEPGMHEFLIISAINGGVEIVFTRDLLKTYDPKGNIQIIRVPSYKNLTVTGTLYCNAWNPVTKTGGVLAVIVARTVTLTANIDVSGLGLNGGAASAGDGTCWNTDGTYGLEYYDQTSTKAGFKGEGIAIHNDFGSLLLPNYAKGLGQNYTGGGGGNGRYSGGGGGSNRGAGGLGGIEDCFPALPGGRGGSIANVPLFPERIFMGGGGGASTGASSQGGNGGGIVIIVADAIEGNGGKILADGFSGSTTTNAKGSGGGGAGGSIALSLTSYGTNTLTFSASGGRGGDNPSSFGEGGGGGGGLIFVSTNPPGTVSWSSVGGGKAGNDPGSTGTGGGSGEQRLNFKAVLNGFLFNSIKSSVTNNQRDSICAGMALPVIKGTAPVGGTGPGTYTYIWRKSYKRNFASPILLKSTTNPADINYTPTAADAITPTDSVFFKRTIKDSSPTQMVDSSNWVKFTVFPIIQNNNIIADPDSICIGSDPQLLKQGVPDLVVPQTKGLRYEWQDSTVGGVWGAFLETTFKVKEFDPHPPGGLLKDTWYRRIVRSGSCTDKGAIAKVTKIDVIQNNAFVKLFDTICFGGNTNLNPVAGPTGGVPGKYKYEWESSTVSSTGPWSTIAGETSKTFDPDASISLPVGNHFYRRIVYSGELNTCKDIAPAATRKVWPVITNNSKISPDLTIGYDSIPPKITATDNPPLAGGDGTYKFTWGKATTLPVWSNAVGTINTKDYSPPNLQITTWFRRRVNSSVCTSVSDSVKITVDALITNLISLANSTLDTIYTGSPSSVVNGSLPTGGSGVLNDYAFKWYLSTEPVPTNAGWAVIAAETTQNLTPGILTQTTWFRRDVSSPKLVVRATVKSNFIKVTVLPKIINVNILPASQQICYGKRPLQLKGSGSLSGGDGKYKFTWQDSTALHTWQNITGFVICDSANYKPPALFADTKYRRIVYSGKLNCCSETSKSVSVKENTLPTGKITNTADTTTCSGSPVILKIQLTGAAPWKVNYRENSTDSPVIPVTSVVSALSVLPSAPAALNINTYTLVKIEDINGCLATSFTGSKKANVYKTPVANAGPDQVVCGPNVTLTAVPSAGTGLWTFPPGVTPSALNTPSVTGAIDPATLTGASLTYLFSWEETNWTCKNKDDVSVIFERPVTNIYAGADTILNSFDNAFRFNPDPIEKWETGIWSSQNVGISYKDIDGDGISDVANDLSKGINTFKWRVTNGLCENSDFVDVTVEQIEVPEGFSPGNAPDGYNDTFVVKGLDLVNQIAELSIVNSAGAEVFATNNRISNDDWIDWDGKNLKGIDLPEGTYYYLLKITSDPKKGGNGQVFKKSGFVVLKRY